MTHPNPEEVSVATNVLRSEAGEWDAQGATIGPVGTKVAAMEFGRLEAGLFQLMAGPYIIREARELAAVDDIQRFYAGQRAPLPGGVPAATEAELAAADAQEW